MFLSSTRDKFTGAFLANLSDMSLLDSGRQVGAHRDGQWHSVSKQISINLGKTFLRISCLSKIAVA